MSTQWEGLQTFHLYSPALRVAQTSRKDEQGCAVYTEGLMTVMVIRGSCSRGKGFKVPSSLPLPSQVRIWNQLALEPLKSQKMGNWGEIRDVSFPGVGTGP